MLVLIFTDRISPNSHNTVKQEAERALDLGHGMGWENDALYMVPKAPLELERRSISFT